MAEAVLHHGDRLIATARKPEQLQDLVDRHPEIARAIALDVTSLEPIQAALQQDQSAFGQINVLVNNAGYGLILLEQFILLESDSSFPFHSSSWNN